MRSAGGSSRSSRSSRRVRCRAPGRGGWPGALFEDVFDVFAAEGLEAQGVLDGAGDFFGAVDLGQGDDLAGCDGGLLRRRSSSLRG